MKAVRYSLLCLCLLAASALGQQAHSGKQNELVGGKLMYVGRMPGGIDAWVINDLKAWGRYKPTQDPEGVDLTMKAYAPETRTEYRMRNGIPQPREEKKKVDHEPVMFVVTVTDWVTGKLLWQAEIIDRKPKRGEDMPPGNDVKIRAAGFSGDQIAQAIVRELRKYVEHLAPQSGSH
jgi:hypothetical protein